MKKKLLKNYSRDINQIDLTIYLLVILIVEPVVVDSIPTQNK